MSIELRTIEDDFVARTGVALPLVTPNRVSNFGTSTPPDLKTLAPTGLQLKSGSGWNAPDSWGTWSSRAEAQLSFQLPHAEKYCLYALVTASLLHEELPISAQANEGQKWHGKAYPKRRALIILDLGQNEIDQPISITFNSGEPINFSLLENTPDSRTIGFALIELRVLPKAHVDGRLKAMEEMVSRYLN